jgi:hypothetical protein
MDAKELRAYDGQVVELRLNDGMRVRARIISIDPDVAENHVFCEALEVLEPGTALFRMDRPFWGVSAQEITGVLPSHDAS